MKRGGVFLIGCRNPRVPFLIYVREFFIHSFISLKQDLSRRSIVIFMTLSRIAARNKPVMSVSARYNVSQKSWKHGALHYFITHITVSIARR